MFPRSNTRRPTTLNSPPRADRKPNGMVSIKPRAIHNTAETRTVTVFSPLIVSHHFSRLHLCCGPGAAQERPRTSATEASRDEYPSRNLKHYRHRVGAGNPSHSTGHSWPATSRHDSGPASRFESDSGQSPDLTLNPQRTSSDIPSPHREADLARRQSDRVLVSSVCHWYESV